MAPGPYPEMIGIKEAVTRTGISYYALRRMCLKGEIAHIRLNSHGGKILINWGKLCEHLDNAGAC